MQVRMKRIALIFIFMVFQVAMNAQGIKEGLRYSEDQNIGTARFTALSGAMGALGGDLSAMNVNPAGSSIFLQSNVTISGALYDQENDASYFNGSVKNFSNDSNLNQVGAVFVFDKASEGSILNKFTVGINYNSTKNFDNDIIIAGRGNKSIGNFFLEQAQGIPIDLLEVPSGESISSQYDYLGAVAGYAAQNAFLGYQAFLFDPAVNNDINNNYVSNFSNNNLIQEYSFLSQGYNSKFTLNFAAQFSNEFSIGANLNTHTIDYRESTFLFETSEARANGINRIGFENNLSVLGAGISAQIGAIAKFNDLRLGLSLESPTYYQISEETTQYLESRRNVDNQSFSEAIDPRIINIYEDYNLRTPGKITASAAYIFGQDGLISFDYSYKDYSGIEFDDSDDDFFAAPNQIIENSLKGVSAYKVGGEYRISSLSLRGGLQYEESPYKNEVTVGDIFGFSMGAGYNVGNYFVDLAYSRVEQEKNQQLYSVGLTDSANINSVYSNFILSVGINF